MPDRRQCHLAVNRRPQNLHWNHTIPVLPRSVIDTNGMSEV